MSQHPSLKSSEKGKAHRSVWKRFERLKFLVEKDKWVEGSSIFGLPKIKLIKVKIKKEKAAAAPAEGATPAQAATPTAGGKTEAAGAVKGVPAKEQVKEETKGKKKPERPEKK